MTLFYYTNDIFTCENFRLPGGGGLAVQGDESGSVTNIEQFHSEKQTFNMEFLLFLWDKLYVSQLF